MRRPWRVCLVLSAAVLAAGSSARAGDVLATAPIDPALFRDGEVQRTAQPYGAWTLVCDAIPRLSHRFCSLSAAPVSVGDARMELTVSTGDDGRPAALLRLPLGLSLSFGVRVGSAGPGRHQPERRVAIALCSVQACEAVWSLSPGDITALHDGLGLRVTVRGWRFTAGGRNAAPAPVSTTIDGRGFAEAVTASLR